MASTILPAAPQRVGARAQLSSHVLGLCVEQLYVCTDSPANGSHLLARSLSLSLPYFTLLPRVHGRANGALKVLCKVLGVAEGAHYPELVWAVRVSHQALMRALGCTHGTPHLCREEERDEN